MLWNVSKGYFVLRPKLHLKLYVHKIQNCKGPLQSDIPKEKFKIVER